MLWVVAGAYAMHAIGSMVEGREGERHGSRDQVLMFLSLSH